MELWCFGMSSAGGQYMDGLEGRGRRSGHCLSWRTSCSLVGCVLQGVTFSDLIKESLLSRDTALMGHEGLFSQALNPSALPRDGAVGTISPPNSASIKSLHH